MPPRTRRGATTTATGPTQRTAVAAARFVFSTDLRPCPVSRRPVAVDVEPVRCCCATVRPRHDRGRRRGAPTSRSNTALRRCEASLSRLRRHAALPNKPIEDVFFSLLFFQASCFASHPSMWRSQTCVLDWLLADGGRCCCMDARFGRVDDTPETRTSFILLGGASAGDDVCGPRSAVRGDANQRTTDGLTTAEMQLHLAPSSSSLAPGR